MLHALNDIASASNNQTTLTATKYFLNYAACNPDASIVYRASDMILRVDSDAAYLVCPGAKSRAGGYHFLGDTKDITFNGPVLVLAKIFKNGMASVLSAKNTDFVGIKFDRKSRRNKRNNDRGAGRRY
eukprot:jgi/Psemu1/31633/gm1.31633_g